MSYSWGNDTSASWGNSSNSNSEGGGFSYASAKAKYDTDKGYACGCTGSCSCGSKKSKLSQNMDQAYKMSTRILNNILEPSEKDLISRLTETDLLVVPGQYDSVEKVLAASGRPYRMNTNYVELDPKQIVMFNCPGGNHRLRYKGKTGTDALRNFTEDGGFVITTDWALSEVVMKAFPGYIERGKRNTGNDLVEVDLVASGSPYTRGLGNGSLKPIWWLEGSSYPIHLLRNENVDILLGSEEMKSKYLDMPIAVKFPVGEGRVVHVTSHFYLQTTKSKYAAQQHKTGLDFATKFLGMTESEANQIGNLESTSFGALDSAYTSTRFLHNIFLEKLRRENQKSFTAQQKQLKATFSLEQLAASPAMSVRALPNSKKSTKLIP